MYQKIAALNLLRLTPPGNFRYADCVVDAFQVRHYIVFVRKSLKINDR